MFNEEQIKSCWNRITLGITAPLLDIYVLARMFKQPTNDGKVSSLSIGYFGNKHVENMVEVLTSLGTILNMKKSRSKYEVLARIDADYSKVSRCLTMPPIDLNDELLKHNHS